MNDIDRWFERAARREDRTVSLYASLLTGKIVGYFVYRMRYALLLDATRYVIHVAEFLIILISLGGLAAFTVMMLRVSSLIVSGAWWGLLEVMRERLRALTQSGDTGGIEREIGRWLALSAVAAAVVTVGGGVALVLLFPPGQDALGSLYAFLSSSSWPCACPFGCCIRACSPPGASTGRCGRCSPRPPYRLW